MQRTLSTTIILPNYCIFCEKVSKGKAIEKLMKCEIKQQIRHGYSSIAQQAIHEAAKFKIDSKII